MGDRNPTFPLLTLQIPSSSTHIHSEVRQSQKNPNVDRPNAIGSLSFIEQSAQLDSNLVSPKDPRAKDSIIDENVFVFSSCQQIFLENDDWGASDARANAARFELSGRKLASCHADGRAYIWDLGKQQIIGEFGSTQRMLGFCLRRLAGEQSFDRNYMIYQTRDALGTVTLHDAAREMAVATRWETKSRTFCAISPCLGDSNLIAMPSHLETHISIRDVRVAPQGKPVFHFHGAGIDVAQNPNSCGMVTSVAMNSCPDGTGRRHMVACGMENGDLVLHDLLMMSNSGVADRSVNFSAISVGTDPILSVDLAPSSSSTKGVSALVAVAGLAGDAFEIENSIESQKGRIAVFKATHQNDDETLPGWNLRQRARIGIGQDIKARRRMAGVSICRFRSDGRLFAAGGWDRRLRIYDRSGDAAPVALLKGHTASVDAMDWAPDADVSGLIATGASDGTMHVWRCFNKD
ncbi:hypothetical protein ACA910_010653 [Epithemia clementina (nom. ined.)]